MARSGDVYQLPATSSWVYPSAGGTIDVAGWTTLINDIQSALTDSFSRTQGSMGAQFKAISGNAAAPGISFTDETNSGWYRQASGVFRYAVAGIDTVEVSASALKVRVGASWYNVLLTGGTNTFTGTLTSSGGTFSGSWAGDPVFSGNPTTTTQSSSDNSTRIATTAYVKANLTGFFSAASGSRILSGASVSTDAAAQVTGMSADAYFTGSGITVNTNDFTIVTAGKYECTFNGSINTTVGSGNLNLYIYKNGAAALAWAPYSINMSSTSNPTPLPIHFSGVFDATTGDVITLYGNAGGAVSINGVFFIKRIG